MKITLDQHTDSTITVENDEFSQKWLEFTDKIYKADRLIYSVDIDGQVLYEDYENYIQEHFQYIQHIHVSTLSRLESIHDTTSSLHEYLNKFVPAMASIADQMYGEMSPELWEQFTTGLEGLQWIVSSFEFLQYLYSEESLKLAQLTNYCMDLEKIIIELDVNLSKEDLVGVGDLLQYELLPHLEKYQSEIRH